MPVLLHEKPRTRRYPEPPGTLSEVPSAQARAKVTDCDKKQRLCNVSGAPAGSMLFIKGFQKHVRHDIYTDVCACIRHTTGARVPAMLPKVLSILSLRCQSALRNVVFKNSKCSNSN